LTGVLSRPPYELRHYFDLIRQLLRIRDDLQAVRIIAVLHGIRGSASRLLPDMEGAEALLTPQRESQAGSSLTVTDTDRSQTHGLRRSIPVSDTEGVLSQSEQGDTTAESQPTTPPTFTAKGLLTIVIDECNRDPRRAYQCMKFLVELASENPAVIDQLSRFPELWEPAVDWLRRLIESSAEAVTTAPTNRLAVPKNLSSTFVPDTEDNASISSYRPRAMTVGNHTGYHSVHRKLFGS
uniref:RICTOR_N domain-containing protein n=1 Tax=Schistocephalus solidus TaxID=70667 RepID=A0A183TKT7_SCHSO